MLVQAISSFIVSIGCAMLFEAPKQSLLKCGLVGMVGWTIYYLLVQKGYEAVMATFIASFSVALISHIFAKKYKAPVIIFTVGGIMPLVPGGTAYDAMKHFVL